MVLFVLIDHEHCGQAHKQQDTAAIEAFRDARKIDSFNAKGATAPTINISTLKKLHYEPSVKFNGSSTLHSIGLLHSDDTLHMIAADLSSCGNIVKRKISDMANQKSEPSVEDFRGRERLSPSQEGESCPVVVRPSVELLCAYGSDSD